MHIIRTTRSGTVAFCLLLTLFATATAGASDRKTDAPLMPGIIVGTWYLSLDAAPFDPGLEGFYLSGIAQIHADRTFMASDAGDFGAESFFPTMATPQYGAWALGEAKDGRPMIHVTTLFLEADKHTGEALGWNKVKLALQIVDAHNVAGTINVFFLPCEIIDGVPSPVTCPDPIENAAEFIPASPPDVPVTLRRLAADG